MSAFVEKRIGSRLGNVLVWLSLILGQPLCIMMYYHDYVITHLGKEFLEQFSRLWFKGSAITNGLFYFQNDTVDLFWSVWKMLFFWCFSFLRWIVSGFWFMWNNCIDWATSRFKWGQVPMFDRFLGYVLVRCLSCHVPNAIDAAGVCFLVDTC